MRVTRGELEAIDLEVHDFLRGVPLEDVNAIDLPHGGEGRTIADVRALFDEREMMKSKGVTAALFKLRFFLGRIFEWDQIEHAPSSDSYVHRVSPELRAR